MLSSIWHRRFLASLLAKLVVAIGASVAIVGVVAAPLHAATLATSTGAVALALQPGQVAQLVALEMATPVVWTITEKSGGSVTADGKYTAPAAAGTYHVVAYPKATPGKSSVFTVVVKPATTTTTVTTPTVAEPTFGTERLYPLPGGGVMRMRYVPAGAFDMGNSEQGDDADFGTGDERPKHKVTLDGFWVGKWEVTRGQYRQFMKAGGYAKRDYWSAVGWNWCKAVGRVQPDSWEVEALWGDPPGMFKQTDDHPVVGVNYYEAEAFCRWAGVRLPTEAEWEKAARWDGQRTRIYAWGDEWDVNRCNNANDSLYPGSQTAPIGKFPQGASACGSLDMTGNVWEWGLDWFDPEYFAKSPSANPQGPSEGYLRILKGGSWFGTNFVGPSEDDRLRAALRTGFEPENSNGAVGFRCVVTTMPASAK